MLKKIFYALGILKELEEEFITTVEEVEARGEYLAHSESCQGYVLDILPFGSSTIMSIKVTEAVYKTFSFYYPIVKKRREDREKQLKDASTKRNVVPPYILEPGINTVIDNYEELWRQGKLVGIGYRTDCTYPCTAYVRFSDGSFKSLCVKEALYAYMLLDTDVKKIIIGN